MKKSLITPILIGITVISGIFFLREYNLKNFDKEEPQEETIETSQGKKFYERKEWQENARKVLNAEEGEVIYTTNNGLKRPSEKPKRDKSLQGLTENQIILMLNTVEFKTKAHKSVIKFLKKGIPQSLPGCYLQSTSIFKPRRVIYKGNGVYETKMIVTFECDESYTNRFLFKVRSVFNTSNHTWRNTLLKQTYL